MPKGYYGERNWTPDDVEVMVALLDGGRTDVAIGRRLGRSAEAVNLKRKRLGLASRRERLLSTRQVARMMGVGCSKAIAKWIRRGYLSGRRGQRWGPHRQWYVTRAALYDFVKDARYQHLWREAAIADPALRAYAREVIVPERYLSPSETASRFCVGVATVNQWIHKGFLRAKRNGNWMIPESALREFSLPQIGGRRSRS